MTNLTLADVLSEGRLEQVDLEQVQLDQQGSDLQFEF